MEIYLIRHTAPEIEKGICYGHSDIGVKDSFNKEVEQIFTKHPYLKTLDLPIYSSPLNRCTTLAKTLFDVPIKLDDRLKELDFGDWELQKWDAINENELSIWMKDFVHTKTTNGESYIDLQTRVLGFLNSVNTHKKIIIVAHAGVIRTILANYKKVDLKDSFDFKIAYGEVIHIGSTNFLNRK